MLLHLTCEVNEAGTIFDFPFVDIVTEVLGDIVTGQGLPRVLQRAQAHTQASLPHSPLPYRPTTVPLSVKYLFLISPCF